MAQSRNAGKRRSASTSRFAMTPRNDVPRSAFDIQHTHKTTFGSGYLYPIYVDEVLPGDSVRLRMHAFARLATPIVPVMDNLTLESFFFFVPNRLLWEHWQAFMGEKATMADTTEYIVPQHEVTDLDLAVAGSLYDYMGVNYAGDDQVTAGFTLSVNALPFRAYNLIWNEWFRDPDLQDPVAVDLSDGPDTTTYDLLRRGKRHDYFTTARPWPQKPINATDYSTADGQLVAGGPMTMPWAGAPVSGIGIATSDQAGSSGGQSTRFTGGRSKELSNYYTDDLQRIVIEREDVAGGYPAIRVLINDMRTANSVQLLLEKNARGGTRYSEIVRSHFGVLSPDARLQRPEYLGGGRSPITVNPVAQTSASGLTGSTTVLGEQAGVGSAAISGHGFSQSFTEHGYILGMVQVRADLSYQQGVNRMWFRRTQFDFYWPSLAHLGEQAILSRELYLDGTASDTTVFGYQERWSEYKYKPNRTSGYMRSGHPTAIDFWHFGQEFASRPTLNNTFIEDNPPVDRVLQVTASHAEEFLLDSMFEVRMARCMPMYSIPGLGPRF